MMDYRKILMLRSKGCSQREMERSKVTSREKTKEVYEAADKLPAYLFVAVLSCSCYTYAEACEDMQTENCLACHIHAFQYFGGVARLLIPDNCKTATTTNTRYETVLNHSYQELAEYYGTAIVPARIRKPQNKSTAEASVRFAETWIIAALPDLRDGPGAGLRSLRQPDKAGRALRQGASGERPWGNPGVQRSALHPQHQQSLEKRPRLARESSPAKAAEPNKSTVSNSYSITRGASYFRKGGED